MKESEKPTVFISFNNKYRDFVDCLEERLSKEANVLRYEDQIPAWGSFVSFMDTIKEQDFAVLVISDEYLKSFACMYEVTQVMKCDNWKDIVLPYHTTCEEGALPHCGTDTLHISNSITGENIFYGDINIRRSKILNELSKEFNIKIIRNCFVEK